MNSTPIGYHKWFSYLFCFVFWYFLNKEYYRFHILQNHIYITYILSFYLHTKDYNTTLHNKMWSIILLLYQKCLYTLSLPSYHHTKYALLPHYHGCLYTICAISFYLHIQYKSTTLTHHYTPSKHTHTSPPHPNLQNTINKATSYPKSKTYLTPHNYLRRNTTTTLILLVWLSYLPTNKQTNYITYNTNLNPQRDHTTNTILSSHHIYTHPNHTTHPLNLMQEMSKPHQYQPYHLTLLLLYNVLVTLYFLYNNKYIPTLHPFYIIHKIVYTSCQQTSTHLSTKIKTLTVHIKHNLIPNTQITKLMTISLIVTLWLGFTLTTHQAHALPPQHIHPTLVYRNHHNPNTTYHATNKS